MNNLNDNTEFDIPKRKKGGMNAFTIILCLMAFMALLPYATDSRRGFSTAAPRMRISRSASLTLTTSWQTIDYNGVSSYNIDSYPSDPGSGNPVIYWDATNKLCKFIGNFDTGYDLFWSGATTVSLLTTPATLRLRFVVQAGNGYASTINFPDPDGDGYVDVGAINASTHRSYPFSIPLYATDQMRKNGFQVQVCLSNALAIGTTITLDRSALLLSSPSAFN